MIIKIKQNVQNEFLLPWIFYFWNANCIFYGCSECFFKNIYIHILQRSKLKLPSPQFVGEWFEVLPLPNSHYDFIIFNTSSTFTFILKKKNPGKKSAFLLECLTGTLSSVHDFTGNANYWSRNTPQSVGFLEEYYLHCFYEVLFKKLYHRTG